MNNARVFVTCGRVKHGKTTLAAKIAHQIGHPWGDCSSIIYRNLAQQLGTTVSELCQRDKESIRQQLIDTGDRLCEGDPGHLAKQLYYGDKARVIAGIRRATELRSLMEAVGEKNVIPVWIHRNNVPRINDNTDEAGLIDMCRVDVDNLGTEGDLDKVAEIISLINFRPSCLVNLVPLVKL